MRQGRKTRTGRTDPLFPGVIDRFHGDLSGTSGRAACPPNGQNLALDGFAASAPNIPMVRFLKTRPHGPVKPATTHCRDQVL